MGRGAMALLAVQVSDLAGEPGGEAITPSEGPEMTVRGAIAARRTVRRYADTPLDRGQMMDLLWAGQGITDPARGFRAAPSAGALYPMELHAVVGESSVTGLRAGVYRFRPRGKFLERGAGKDLRGALAEASLDQMWMAPAPVSIVICGVYGRTTGKYGERGIRYVHMEAGCTAENIFLMAASLGLATGIVGAFRDEEVAALLNLPPQEKPLLVMPIGHKK